MERDDFFREGRQFGRGKSGGQVRDEYRTYYDVGRGGYGKLLKTELDALAAGAEEGAGGAAEGYRGDAHRRGFIRAFIRSFLQFIHSLQGRLFTRHVFAQL